MATIGILLSRKPPPLVRIVVARAEPQKRFMYGYPEFQKWLVEDLPRLERGRLKAVDSPEQQVDNILFRWLAGKRIVHERQFNDMQPLEDGVWEMKTPDIRIFGWMFRKLRFVAVFADYADLYKATEREARKKSYRTAMDKVIAARDKLDLDRPKFVVGEFDGLVRV